MKKLILLTFLLVNNAMAAEQIATFAGGCFWCMQPPYDKLPGVIKTVVGYTGGHIENPRYEDVTAGDSGHYEAIQVHFDADKVSYEEILDVFWRNVDPTDAKGQFCDRGDSYRTAIFVSSDRQKSTAQKNKLDTAKKYQLEITTPILPATTFYPAEEYHQDYYKKNPVRYKFYRYSCGRDKRLQQLWGDKP